MFSESSRWVYYSREYTTQGSILLFTWISNHLKYLGECFIYKKIKNVKSVMSMKSIRSMTILQITMSIEDMDHFKVLTWMIYK